MCIVYTSKVLLMKMLIIRQKVHDAMQYIHVSWKSIIFHIKYFITNDIRFFKYCLNNQKCSPYHKSKGIIVCICHEYHWFITYLHIVASLIPYIYIIIVSITESVLENKQIINCFVSLILCAILVGYWIAFYETDDKKMCDV